MTPTDDSPDVSTRARGPRACRRLLAAAALSVLLVAPLRAQVVRGVVSDTETRAPVAGAMVLLLGADDRTLVRVLTAEDGAYILSAPVEGRYRLRVDRIGYASVVSDPFDVPAGPAVVRDVTTGIEPVALEGIDVEGSRRCEVRPAEGLATARVWEEARKALAAAAWTAERGLYRFAWRRYVRDVGPDGRRVLDERRTLGRSYTAQPFVAVPAEQLAEEGFVGRQGTDNVFYAPDATVLLSDAFLDTHCLALAGDRTDEGLIGLRFEPVRRRRLPEVEGVLWLERAGARLRSVVYDYVNLGRTLEGDDASGEIRFRALPNGTWIVQEWRIRMPRIQERRATGGFASEARLLVLGYRDEGGEVRSIVTSAGDPVQEARAAASISGAVRDSLGGPVEGARVWLEGTDREVRSGPRGAFTFADVAPGSWRVGASVAALDALGAQGAVREVDVAGADPVDDVLLELPSVGRAVLERCDAPPGEHEGALYGTVVDDGGDPVSGAAVRATWTVVRRAGLPNTFRLNDSGLRTETDGGGRFVLCGVPTGFPARVTAFVGERASEEVEVRFTDFAVVVPVRVVLPREGQGEPTEAAGAAPGRSPSHPGADTPEARWLAGKGFSLRADEALLHQTGAEVRRRGLTTIERILEQAPRVEVLRTPAGGNELRLHHTAGWGRGDAAGTWCALDLYLNGNLALQSAGDPDLTPDRILDLHLPELSAVELFDADVAPVAPTAGCGVALLWYWDMPEHDVDFEARLSGRIVTGDEERPAAEVLVTLEPGAHRFRTDERGRFDLGRLPPARYVLTATLPEWGAWSSEVRLRAGDDHDLTIHVGTRTSAR